MPDFNIQGKVQKKSSPLGISLAKVKVYQLGQTAPLAETPTGIDGSFNVTFPWSGGGRPDVHFKVTQMIDGAEKVIYNENPATQTRFNIADFLSVTLKTEEGLAAASPATGVPYDSLFVFTRVGLIGVNQIDTTASGYALPDTSAAAPNSADANSPFGSTLDIAGWFGQFADVYRYKVWYDDGSGSGPQYVNDPLANSYFEFALGGGNWITMAMGPFTEGGQSNVYKLPHIEKPGQPWIFPDLIARWDTTKVANNLYTLGIEGFKVDSDGTTLVLSSSLIIDSSFGNLKLRIDNSPPVVHINSIQHSPTSLPGDFVPVGVCDIVEFSTGTLRFQFEASDAQGHLKSYSLGALFGHNQSVAPPPTTPNKAVDSYANHINATRHWNGGTFSVDYDGDAYTPAKMPECAYQFRLNVTKRTTNGYGNIFAGLEDTVHITLDRP